MKKHNKGITLIALVITIVVLLILAMVSIRLVMNGGVIGKSEYAAQIQKIEQIEEKIKLQKTEMEMDKYKSGQTEEITVKEILEKNGEDTSETISIASGATSIPKNMPEGEYYIVTPEKYAFNNENTRRYAKLTSRGEERAEDILKNVYVINAQFEVYYVIEGIKGESKKPPTDQKYLLFKHNEEKGTSTFVGMNSRYRIGDGIFGEGEYIINDLVIPEVVKNDRGEDSIVTSIGAKQMGEVKIKTVVIPDSVEIIDDYSFYLWTGMTEIKMPSKVTKIGQNAFSHCLSLTTITLPNGFTVLNGSVFEYCRSLTSITLPEGVTTLNGPVFNFCTGLTSVYLPSSLNNITEDFTFRNCSSDLKIYVNKYKKECTSWDPNWACNATVIYKTGTNPENVTDQEYLLFTHDETTGTSKFMGMNPKYLMDNGYYDKDGCIITDLVIPTVVKNNSEEDSIVTSIGTELGTDGNNATIKSVVLPETIEMIDAYAFYRWTALTAITIPEGIGITILEGPVFGDCTSLTSITIPEGVTTLSGPVFRGCTSLTSAKIPSSVTSITPGAFSGCPNLTIYIDKYQSECSSWPPPWKGSATVIFKKQNNN